MPISADAKLRSCSGFSLLELMVSLGLAGIVFLALMTLLSQSARFSGYFHGSASVVEGVADVITQMNTAVSQIVRIDTCACRVATPTHHLSNCLWNDNTTANAWFDPVRNGGASDSGNGGLGHELLVGQFESFYGGDNTNNTTQLLTGNLGTFGTGIGGCETHDSFVATNRRGCKQKIRLYYKAPTNDAGAVPGNSGAFSILLGNAAPSTTAAGLMRVGNGTSRGVGGLGVTELACGFNQATGTNSTSGMLFVLNLKLKGRSNSVLSPTNSQYESWYPTGAGYRKGMLRDVQMKLTLRNLGSRGLYFWRPQTVRGCRVSGATAALREQCCSGALSAGVCLGECVASGAAAASETACCSEQLVSGVCR